MDQQKRRLVIYFDVSSTVLMQDRTQPLELTVKPRQLNKILAAQCWGTCEVKEDTRVWKLAHNSIAFVRPQPELISYT